MICTECGEIFQERTNKVTCSKACAEKRHRTRTGLADNELNAAILKRYEAGERAIDIAWDLRMNQGAVRQRICLARKHGALPVFNAIGQPKYDDANRAWEKHRADLVETHRREFLAEVYGRKAA